jgi:cytoskeletal protein CcmA (bactofilin family)
MVFRRDSNKVDSFQRQMNALRQQIGDDEAEDAFDVEEDRYVQVDRGRQGRQAGDEGYSFGTYPSSSGGQQVDFGSADAPAVPEMPQVDQQVSVVAAGTTWQGDVETQGSLHVYGKANGTLKATEDIWIADGAEVDARIEADRVVIGGEVSGQVTAHSRFEALPSCDIQADIDAPIFVVHEGATVNGAMTMKTTSTPIDIDGRDSRGRGGSIIQRRARSSS